jgi:hypothetical protein
MPIPSDDFPNRMMTIVREHYARTRTPLLLAHLGVRIEKEQLWPEDRGQHSLKQLIKERCGSELAIIFDKRSPAYVAVVTPDVRADVEAQMAERLGEKDTIPVRLEELARPVLLAFCINVQNQNVYIRRARPFRYEIGQIPAENASEYVLIEQEYRKPGLRIEHLNTLSMSDRHDLQNLIQKWALVHSLDVAQFSRQEQEEKEATEVGKSALDRLIAAQPPDIANRLLVPADIALVLSKLR